MYRLYRFFSSYGYGTDFIRSFRFLPQSILKRIGLIPVSVKHR